LFPAATTSVAGVGDGAGGGRGGELDGAEEEAHNVLHHEPAHLAAAGAPPALLDRHNKAVRASQERGKRDPFLVRAMRRRLTAEEIVCRRESSLVAVMVRN
jgi:hypothetical protein